VRNQCVNSAAERAKEGKKRDKYSIRESEMVRVPNSYYDQKQGVQDDGWVSVVENSEPESEDTERRARSIPYVTEDGQRSTGTRDGVEGEKTPASKPDEDTVASYGRGEGVRRR